MNKTSGLAVLAALSALAPAARAAAIGPDAFGYVITQAATGSFTSIVGVGGTTLLTNALGGAAQDDVTFTVNPGFNIPFYGNLFSSVFVSTNGFIAFGGNTGSATAGSHANADLSQPTILNGGTGQATVERAVVGVYWDDLYFTNSVAVPGGLYMLTRNVAGVDELVLEWNGVQYFGATANSLTFQAIIRANGTMQFNYPDASGPAGQSDGASASIGLHDLNGGGATNRYLKWDFNTAGSVTDGVTLDVTLAGGASVPEPASLSLVALALLGGIGYKIRRRSKTVAAQRV